LELGNRILEFFNFVYTQGFEAGICWHENEFHVTVTKDGNIYGVGQKSTLTAALDECADGFKRVGM